MSGVEQLAQLVEQQLALGARHVAARIDERGMTCRLPQPQQRLEDLHPRLLDAAFADASEERGAVVISELVVEFFLLPFELAVERLLGALRQLGGDLLFRPAEDQRTQRAGQRVAAFGRCVARGERPLEPARVAEESRIEELEEAPQLAEVVLDRRAAEREPVL